MCTWHGVSHREPCRICDKPDWCSFSADGIWALCRRLDAGVGIHKVDKTGADYWLCRLDGHTPSRLPIIELPFQPCRSRVERADPLTLDHVYRALLATLPLSPPHRQPLRQRGLSDRRTPLHIVPPAYAAPVPQLANSLPQSSNIELSNSAAIPHPSQSLTHEACAPDVHADLQAVITSWPTLSEERRAAILQLIQGEEVQP